MQWIFLFCLKIKIFYRSIIILVKFSFFVSFFAKINNCISTRVNIRLRENLSRFDKYNYKIRNTVKYTAKNYVHKFGTS